MAKRDDPVVLEGARLPGRKYEWDKPRDCRYCYWYQNRKKCKRESCFYLLPLEKKESEVFEAGNCKTCPYGQHSPCIGFCLVKIMLEMKK